MKKLLIVPLLFVSSLSFAEEPNPFMSAEDRQAHIEKESKKEEDKLQKMVAEAVKEIKEEIAKKEVANQDISGLGGGNLSGDSYSQRGSTSSSSTPKALPADFAIAGIKENYILMRQMDNKSIIVSVGEVFYDQGNAYEASIVGNEIVSIIRLSDGNVVFYGGVGSVFTPSAGPSSSSNNMEGNYAENGNI